MPAFKDFVVIWRAEETLTDEERDRYQKRLVPYWLFIVLIVAIVLPGNHLHSTFGQFVIYPAIIAVAMSGYSLMAWRRLKKRDLPTPFLRLWKLRAVILGSAGVVLIPGFFYLWSRLHL